MIAAILQARVSSSRLPGKVLKQILGRPMIGLQIERLKRLKSIDSLIVATSDHSSDDELALICGELGVKCFRGSLDDVLDRFYQAALTVEPDHIVRLTGDCPLTDPDVIDRVTRFYFDGNFDYASNTIAPTFPDGLDAELFSFEALKIAWQEAKLPSEREHVTPYLYTHPSRFTIGSYREEPDISHFRWTVDEEQDFEFVSAVYENLYPTNPEFDMEDVLALLKRRPDLLALNQGIERNAGSRSARMKDYEYLAKRK